MSESHAFHNGLDEHSMLLRPERHLDALSVEMKWETTRRHPMYSWLWDTWTVCEREFGNRAANSLANNPGVQLVWVMLGINGVPADPALDFESLSDPDINARWLKRSARPVTYRHLAKILQAKLSAEGLSVLSTMLFSGGQTELGSEEREDKLLDLVGLDWPELDRLVDADIPLLQYNPAAPSKEFVSDITNLRNELRNRLAIEDARTNESQLKTYLAAWDVREGWKDGSYDRAATMMLKRVSEELGINQRQAKYAYQKGFQLISGHEFSMANWIRLMGVPHFSESFGGDVSPVALNRLLRSASVRGVDDSTLSSGPSESGPSVLANAPGDDFSFDAPTAICRINDLLRSGTSTAQILADLRLDESAAPAIEELRSLNEMEGD